MKEIADEFIEDCEIVLGFNTKQWQIYSNTYDVYIDPPTEILDELREDYDTEEKQEAHLRKIIERKPSWLMDEQFWYDDIE